MDKRPNRLIEGQIVEYEGRRWLVGMVNDCRARLDPLTGKVAHVADRTFVSYGSSVNISPGSAIPVVDPRELTQETVDRINRLKLANSVSTTHHSGTDNNTNGNTDSRGDTMATEQTVGTAVAAAPIPAEPKAKRAARKLSVKPKNEARPLGTAKAKTAKANGKSGAARIAKATKGGVAKAPVKVKTAKAKSAKPKTAKVERACGCGCGEKTSSYFRPGHDARYHGWLKRLQSGDMELSDLKAVVRNAHTWVKRGDGVIPRLDYRGDAYKPHVDRD